MTAKVEYPDIRYVVYPVHLDGTLTGGSRTMRHDPDCGHFVFGGETLGTPVLATEEQMQSLKPCGTCAGRRSGRHSGSAPRHAGAKLGQLCQSCHQVMSLTGVCDNCG